MNIQDIKLPPPQIKGGMPIMEVFAKRKSERDFTEKVPDLQTISNLLWAAWGYNRERKRTAPSSHNRQEIKLFICIPSGTYLYDAQNNTLIFKNNTDLRKDTGEQDFVGKAPLNIVIVADTSKITGKTPNGIIETIYANSGFISENIYLYCISAGMGSVTRALVPKEILKEKLDLSPTEIITLVHTAGYTE